MSRMPDSFRTLSGEIRKLREEVRQLRNRSAFDNSGLTAVDPGQLVQSGSITIPDNGLLLVDGGDVVMLNDALVEVFRVGVMAYGDRGLAVSRDDGTMALEMRKPFSAADTTQVFLLRDRNGAIIGGDALLSPSGFDAPHLPMQFVPVDYTSAALAQSTSSGTFTATHEHRGFRQNPALKPQFMVKCSDGTTAAEVRIWDVNGATYLGGAFGSPAILTATVPTGTTAFTLFQFSAGAQLPGAMSAALHLQIHARVTAGTGSVTVAPVRTIGSGF